MLILIWHAIVLGVVQGLAEFLPISSSAHLIIVPTILGWDHFGQVFDVSLHVGTAVAVLAYFGKDLLALFTSEDSDLVQLCGRGRFLFFLALSAIPGAIVGAKFDSKIEKLTDPEFNHNIAHIFLFFGLGLALFGLLMGIADRMGRKDRGIEMFGWAALWMGLMQALALFPGVSRSGITMTTGLFMGLRREVVARFSFLISLPIMCGAALKKTYDVFHHHEDVLEGIATTASSSAYITAAAVYATGIIVSAIVGYLVIRFVIRYLNQGDFTVFVVYRVVLGTLLVMWAFTHWSQYAGLH
jgi:undecaprenyl-diphosphatase